MIEKLQTAVELRIVQHVEHAQALGAAVLDGLEAQLQIPIRGGALVNRPALVLLTEKRPDEREPSLL